MEKNNYAFYNEIMNYSKITTYFIDKTRFEDMAINYI